MNVTTSSTFAAVQTRCLLSIDPTSATTAAVKLSRAYTGKNIIAFPNDHPFYSYDDWFICTKEINSGIPREIKRLSVTYDSRDPDSLNNVFRIAASNTFKLLLCIFFSILKKIFLFSIIS